MPTKYNSFQINTGSPTNRRVSTGCGGAAETQEQIISWHHGSIDDTMNQETPLSDPTSHVHGGTCLAILVTSVYVQQHTHQVTDDTAKKCREWWSEGGMQSPKRRSRTVMLLWW